MARHWSESIAKHYLQSQGYKLLAENYAIRGGELDLIMSKKGVIVFVEVRQRKNDRYGSAAESIRSIKQARLLKTALHFIVESYGHDDLPMRFDAVLLTGTESDFKLEHLENIFQ